MEQLRIMLSEASSKNFTQQVKSLTAFNGGTDGLDPTARPCKSGVDALEKAGENVVESAACRTGTCSCRRRQIGVAGLGEMMAGRAHPGRGHQEDPGLRGRRPPRTSSIKHYKHQ